MCGKLVVDVLLNVIARNEAIANFTGRTCTVCDCHAIARNDILDSCPSVKECNSSCPVYLFKLSTREKTPCVVITLLFSVTVVLVRFTSLKLTATLP